MNESPAPATVWMLALTRYAGVTPRMMDVLLRRFGAPEMICRAGNAALESIEGLSPDMATAITACVENTAAAEEYLEQLSNRDIEIRSCLEPTYPSNLFELNDPPSLLYFRGRLPDRSARTVALCGTRVPGQEGIELTTRLAKMMASAGVQVVSGLDGGIAAAAHLGARAAEGTSFAISSLGFDDVALAEQMPLAIDIVRVGGIIGELAPDDSPGEEPFRAANRIIAAMAQAVVVTEFYPESAHTLDLLDCCRQIGKLTFIMIDDRWGALTDETSLARAVEGGAIPMVGWDKVHDIIKSLV